MLSSKTLFPTTASSTASVPLVAWEPRQGNQFGLSFSPSEKKYGGTRRQPRVGLRLRTASKLPPPRCLRNPVNHDALFSRGALMIRLSLQPSPDAERRGPSVISAPSAKPCAGLFPFRFSASSCFALIGAQPQPHTYFPKSPFAAMIASVVPNRRRQSGNSSKILFNFCLKRAQSGLDFSSKFVISRSTFLLGAVIFPKTVPTFGEILALANLAAGGRSEPLGSQGNSTKSLPGRLGFMSGRRHGAQSTTNRNAQIATIRLS